MAGKSFGDLIGEVEALREVVDNHTAKIVNAHNNWVEYVQSRRAELNGHMEEVIRLIGEMVSGTEVYAQSLHRLGPEGSSEPDPMGGFMAIFSGASGNASGQESVDEAESDIANLLVDGTEGPRDVAVANVGVLQNLGYTAVYLRDELNERAGVLVNAAQEGVTAAQIAGAAARLHLGSYKSQL